jgi:hypothetical protein
MHSMSMGSISTSFLDGRPPASVLSPLSNIVQPDVKSISGRSEAPTLPPTDANETPNLEHAGVREKSVLQHAEALFDYSSDDVHLTAGDKLTIVRADSGTGWTTVKTSEGVAPVPTTYITVQAPSAIALYTYQKAGNDEISVIAGESVKILERGKCCLYR